MISVQARLLTIQAHLTASVGPTATQNWELGRPLPPFLVDNKSAVNFLLAVVENPVGTGIKHSVYVVTEAVVVQVYNVLSNPELDKSNALASIRTAMSAVYVALASLHYNQRVPHPSESTLKRMAVAFTRKGDIGQDRFWRQEGGRSYRRSKIACESAPL
eukprot:849227-Pleurochrysis_carterae.AAC.1